MTDILIASTFSGTGALDAAVPGCVVVACDRYAPARQLQADPHPAARIGRDVTELHVTDLAGVGDLRVLVGGFPCQDLSVAGSRRGAGEGSGTRSALGWEMPRLAAEMDADVVVHENVPAATRMVYPAMRERYGSMGYATCVARFSAAEVGAPHIRERALLVACRSSGAAEIILGATPRVEVVPDDDMARPGWCVPTPTVVDRSWGLTRAEWTSVRERYRRTYGIARGDGIWTYWQDLLSHGAQLGHVRLLRRWERVTGHDLPCGLDGGVAVTEQAVCDMMEWSMGIEPGLVTRRGLSISAQRRLIGNAVVTIAVRRALREALQRIAEQPPLW